MHSVVLFKKLRPYLKIKKYKLKNSYGPAFTLIELLVVIVIIGVLATLAVVAISSARTKARDAKRVSDIKQMQTALELYLADQNEYPPVASVTAGSPLISPDGVKTYMAKLPADSSASQSYKYLLPSSNKYELIYTLEKALSSSAPAGVYLASNQGNIPQGPGDGLIGWWRFDEATGNTAYDSSSSGKNGTLTTASASPYNILPARVPGVSSGALEFTNTGVLITRRRHYVAIPHSSTDSPYNFKNGDSFTLSAWFYYPKRMNGSYSGSLNTFNIVGKYYRYALYIEDNPSSGLFLAGGIRPSGASAYPFVKRSVTTNTWSFGTLVVSANGVIGATAKLYLNGSLVVQSTINNFVTYPFDSSDQALYIGDSSTLGGNPDFFNGTIDDVRIYNRALSDAEVETLFAATKP